MIATSHGWPNPATIALSHAAPVLLEIVAAALELESHTIGTVKRKRAAERYYAALAKVRP